MRISTLPIENKTFLERMISPEEGLDYNEQESLLRQQMLESLKSQEFYLQDDVVINLPQVTIPTAKDPRLKKIDLLPVESAESSTLLPVRGQSGLIPVKSSGEDRLIPVKSPYTETLIPIAGKNDLIPVKPVFVGDLMQLKTDPDRVDLPVLKPVRINYEEIKNLPLEVKIDTEVEGEEIVEEWFYMDGGRPVFYSYTISPKSILYWDQNAAIKLLATEA
ncbi:MAG: hypothetical protein SNJ64_03470, partial [Endomicrobiia bacterium]